MSDRMILDKHVDRVYFENQHGVCFKDTEGSIFYLDYVKKEIEEIEATGSDRTIDPAVWDAFGSLLGHVVAPARIETAEELI